MMHKLLEVYPAFRSKCLLANGVKVADISISQLVGYETDTEPHHSFGTLTTHPFFSS